MQNNNNNNDNNNNNNNNSYYNNYFDDICYNINVSTARKAIFPFSKCSEKMVFPKKLHWNMIFLVVLSGKMIFLFPENMILFFRQKMKDDLSQKNAWKYDIFFKCSESMVFPKKSRLNMIFLVLSGKIIFFFPENINIFFLWSENGR